MLSWGPRPPNNSQVSSSPHPIEVARVFITIAEISAASAEIIRRDEVYLICLRRLNTYLIVVATLEKKLRVMFIYRYVGPSIFPLRISMGRSYVASGTHHPTTSRVLKNI